jgi:hypothetical protein
LADYRGAPIELAAALLEDADGVIDVDVPFAGEARSVRAAAGAALRARIAGLAAKPFDALSRLTGDGQAPAGAVPFVAGDPSLDDRALASIAQLARLLEARPRLGVRVHGAYAAGADREALARQQIELHVSLATAEPGALRAAPEPVDFGSVRVHDVLDEFAGERLPAAQVQRIAARYDCEGEPASPCRQAYYAEIFDALVANEEIAATALRRLGRFRAQSVADGLRRQGIAADRIVVDADAIETPFDVGLPLELTARPPER